jgi:hypothetical protein
MQSMAVTFSSIATFVRYRVSDDTSGVYLRLSISKDRVDSTNSGHICLIKLQMERTKTKKRL